MVTSRPASAQYSAIVDAWTSLPPASGSSRSRHASMLTRCSPDSAARSPSLATSEAAGPPVRLTVLRLLHGRDDERPEGGRGARRRPFGLRPAHGFRRMVAGSVRAVA